MGVSVFDASLHMSTPPVQDTNLGMNCV